MQKIKSENQQFFREFERYNNFMPLLETKTIPNFDQSKAAITKLKNLKNAALLDYELDKVRH